MKKKTKKNPQDLTLRNLRALKRRVDKPELLFIKADVYWTAMIDAMLGLAEMSRHHKELFRETMKVGKYSK